MSHHIIPGPNNELIVEVDPVPVPQVSIIETPIISEVFLLSEIW